MKKIIGFIENDGSYTKINSHKESQKPAIPKAISEAEGFFGPESMHWKLYREPGIIVAGISALLLQIAHPAVAEAVKVYSQYQSDFLGRAHRTILSMTRIWFGSRAEAVQSSERLYHIHGHIRGVYFRTENGRKVAKSYCANEPELLCWILATMTMATVEAYETVYRPLAQREKALFYEETKITAQLMGIPLDKYPSNWKAFEVYYEQKTCPPIGLKDGRRDSSNFLEVGETAEQISADLFAAYFPFAWFVNIFAGGFLPSTVREKFGLKNRSFAFSMSIGFVHLLMRLIPSFLRAAPHYHQAMYRLAKARKESPSLLSKWHHWLANSVPLPLFSNKLNPKI